MGCSSSKSQEAPRSQDAPSADRRIYVGGAGLDVISGEYSTYDNWHAHGAPFFKHHTNNWWIRIGDNMDRWFITNDPHNLVSAAYKSSICQKGTHLIFPPMHGWLLASNWDRPDINRVPAPTIFLCALEVEWIDLEHSDPNKVDHRISDTRQIMRIRNICDLELHIMFVRHDGTNHHVERSLEAGKAAWLRNSDKGFLADSHYNHPWRHAGMFTVAITEPAECKMMWQCKFPGARQAPLIQFMQSSGGDLWSSDVSTMAPHERSSMHLRSSATPP
jgi:hypothetical protein